MSRLYNNIKWVCKQNNVQIADIEKPMKAGYISRHERRNAIECLPLWVLIKVSNACNVSIDELINRDLKSEAELELIKTEIDRLKARAAELSGKSRSV